MDEKVIGRDQQEIHSKGFSFGGRYYYPNPNIDFNKIKVGVKTLDDAVLNLGSISKDNDRRPIFGKQAIFKALGEKDLPTLRKISEYYYNISGIYQRVCNYFAALYRYDWYISPEVTDESIKPEKILKEYARILNYLDASYIKKLCGDIALKVIKEGCYYGYVIPNNKSIMIQDLPSQYCRTRYNVAGMPAIEFNMAFFDEKFTDVGYRMRVLKMFPEEFLKGYSLYKQQKLKQDYYGDSGGWYLLDPNATVKFNLNNSDVPVFVNAIPAILDLDAAQDLDRRKQMQKLLKILVQQLPRDKNGDLIFDVDEASDLHNNAVQMLKRAVGVDVLTTFADVQAIDLSDKNTATSVDDLEKVERSVYNAFGVSRNLFNTDGNLSLEKSILDDESNLRNLLLQFGIFFDKITALKNTNKKKFNFRFYMLETTQYNYKELSKMYKEQVQIGYSKMLPQIALGHSQSSIINTAYFENEVLHLSEIMIPPLMSSTLNGEDILGTKDQSSTSKTQKTSEAQNTGSSGTAKVMKTDSKSAGRPEKADSEKSEKTIKNKESMS